MQVSSRQSKHQSSTTKQPQGAKDAKDNAQKEKNKNHMMNPHAQVMMNMLTTTLKKANIFTKQSNMAILLKDMLPFEKSLKLI